MDRKKKGNDEGMQENQTPNMQEQEQTPEELSEILRIRREKLASLKEEGENPFTITTYERNAYAAQIVEHFDEFEGKEVSVAGRIMSKRGMGMPSWICGFQRAALCRIDGVGRNLCQVPQVDRGYCWGQGEPSAPSAEKFP
ncbi:MAG: hypothetical protein ACLRWC_03710 [Acutalibacter sp.]